MHPDKDALRRSPRAYMIYPGTEEERKYEFHEILSRLGAFPSRPTKEGKALGTDALTRFIEDNLLQVASRLTQHEWERFWVAQAHLGAPPARPVRAATFLSKPPHPRRRRICRFLLGFVKDDAHLPRIKATGRYTRRGSGCPVSWGECRASACPRGT